MNVYLTGCSSQGKSLTARLIAKRLKLNVLDNISRSSAFKIDTKEHQMYMSETVYNSCITMHDTVYCRTPLDVYAYSMAYKSGRSILFEDRIRAKCFAAGLIKVIYFPYLLPIEDDGFRPTDPAFNKRIDLSIKKQLEIYNIDYYRVLLESPEERVEHIIKFLEE